VGVARTEGAAATARALRIDRHRLEARLQATCDEDGTAVVRVGSGVEETTFVEMGASRLGAVSRSVVRFETREGRRLEVECEGDQVELVVRLAESFWRSGR
jgi:Holliday junction resolvase